MWLSSQPMYDAEVEEAAVPEHLAPVLASAGFGEVRDIVMGRCSMCHAAEPYFGPFRWPPKGVRLDTEVEIARHARQIYLQSGLSHAMPPGNLTWMEETERQRIVQWFRSL